MRRLKLYIGLALVLCTMACEDILEVEDISGNSVELLAPANNVTVTNDSVSFNWNEVADADTYRIQIATPDFENAAQMLLDSLMVVDSTFAGPRLSKKLQNNTYQWRVKAMNSGYETNFSTNSFNVENTN